MKKIILISENKEMLKNNPIDNRFQLSNWKSEISNSREHQLMFFYLYLFENSASVTHLSCFSVFVHLELKRKFFHSLSWNYTRSRPQQSSSTLVFKPKGSENIFIQTFNT